MDDLHCEVHLLPCHPSVGAVCPTITSSYTLAFATRALPVHVLATDCDAGVTGSWVSSKTHQMLLEPGPAASSGLPLPAGAVRVIA